MTGTTQSRHLDEPAEPDDCADCGVSLDTQTGFARWPANEICGVLLCLDCYRERVADQS